MRNKFTIIVLALLSVLGVAISLLANVAPEFHTMALHGANVLMALLSIIVWTIATKPQEGASAQAMVRGVYGATLLKLMVCMVGALIYIVLNRNNIHKPTVFVLLGIYGVYSAVETVMLSRATRMAGKQANK